MQLDLLPKAIRAFRSGQLGDAAAFKAAALSEPPYPEVKRRLDQLAQPFPRIDLRALQALEPGTFGHAYAQFIARNGLSPLTLSDAVAAELAGSNVLAVRYPILHDPFHVLLDFDTSLAGELGVWSFVAQQRYSPSYARAAQLARVFYPIVSPLQLRALRDARLRAIRLAHEVPCLIAQPIEEYWSEPLSAVRARLKIRLI